MSEKQVILHRGEKFAVDKANGGRFKKDIVHVGKWFHPVTGKDIVFDAQRIDRLKANTERYLAAGNKIPFRDGHRDSVLATMGEWTGPFTKEGNALVAVVEPKLDKAIEGIKSGAIDGVSVVIKFGEIDSKNNHYDEVITAIDATDFPVLTEQKAFVALSKDAEGNEVYFHESLKLSTADNGDCFAQHDALHSDLKKKVGAFASKKESLGEHHPETKAAGSAMMEAAHKLRKQVDTIHGHVSNMTSGPMLYDRKTEPKTLSVEEALAAQIPDADEVSGAIAIELAKISGKVGQDGKFVGGFDGCVIHMKDQGYSDEVSKKICGKIAQG